MVMVINIIIVAWQPALCPVLRGLFWQQLYNQRQKLSVHRVQIFTFDEFDSTSDFKWHDGSFTGGYSLFCLQIFDHDAIFLFFSTVYIAVRLDYVKLLPSNEHYVSYIRHFMHYF